MYTPLLKFLLGGICTGFLLSCTPEPSPEQTIDSPNVILIMTDDQGYGDLSCHGNPWLETPHLDALHSESMRFTNFHVATTCAPTRGSLMTGKYCNRVGAWHTIKARHIVWPEETMLPELFQQAGYATGMFGKWHLGDNTPYLPQDRGFEEVLIHGGGGVGQTPDYWDNDYFDDTYFHNGVPEKRQGYCTDVWFEAATDFMKSHKEQPFFCYIATNAPHGPFHVDSSYSKPFQGNEAIVNANFLGMIVNIDENIGKLRNQLEEWGIADNTLLVFLTDNGTAAGCSLDEKQQVIKGFNVGMRGKKGSPFEGGHRVPLFLHWKDGKIAGGKDIATLTSVIDLAPTLLDLCGIENPLQSEMDGKSLRPLLEGADWEARTLFADTQREDFLIKDKDYAVMTDQWRLVRDELFDIQQDPGQTEDVSTGHPEVVEQLKAAYEGWWPHVSQRKDDFARIPIGTNPQVLTAHDIHTEGGVAWNQGYIRSAYPNQGYWAVSIDAPGTYTFDLRRWPIESGLSLGDSAPEGDILPTGLAYKMGKALSIIGAKVKIGEEEISTLVAEGAESAKIEMELPKGMHQLHADFLLESGESFSAYYVYVEPSKRP
ncbi:MAG: arylsulfatase [Bacteroidota bacterium]